MNTYYHNPKCSKSRSGLELLQSSNLDFKIKEYLTESLSEDEVEQLFIMLGKEPIEVVRTKESLFKELKLDSKKLNAKEWAQVIVKYPKLLERPILVVGTIAMIGRPTEELKKLLG